MGGGLRRDGKTRVLTNRLLALLLEGQPSQILR